MNAPKPATHRQIQVALREIPPLRACKRRNETAPDLSYNCFAQALDDVHRVWDPGMQGIAPYYWPDGMPEDYHLSTLLMIVDSRGYKACHDGEIEAAFEKIVFYVSARSQPLTVEHVAKQLPDGWWAHKVGLGLGAEVEAPQALMTHYGTHLLFLRRLRRG